MMPRSHKAVRHASSFLLRDSDAPYLHLLQIEIGIDLAIVRLGYVTIHMQQYLPDLDSIACLHQQLTRLPLFARVETTMRLKYKKNEPEGRQ